MQMEDWGQEIQTDDRDQDMKVCSIKDTLSTFFLYSSETAIIVLRMTFLLILEINPLPHFCFTFTFSGYQVLRF